MKGFFYNCCRERMSFSFVNDTDEKHDWASRNKYSHYVILHRLLNYMKDRGFDIRYDKDVAKCIRKDYWVGSKGELRFAVDRYPRGFKFQFYQEIVTENKNGGRYDFDKYEKCPYLIRLSWINETNKIAMFLESLGANSRSDEKYKFAEDKVKKHLVDNCHRPQKDMNFDLKDLHGTTCEGSYNNTDRDGKTICNGQVKYFRYRGRLMRGIVYHNINNMWWVIINKFKYTNEADFELFDPTEEDFKIRRKVKDRKPKAYLQKIENLSKLSDKDLLREMNKRRLHA
ncbi:hypothetical protein EV210_101195 [Anaerospora hongkongensis]|uniref:Uncharacterized protein n=1 Tax=Anaerospora hongkongensis TaxID=244830 RepID=A0A4R1QAP3_9FIRM|nr:hypothetical protein [Anaerospora hongkongensis]TCL39995.1 hypothetical protein EV210_101195 [Anaerospora hongkongensis]